MKRKLNETLEDNAADVENNTSDRSATCELVAKIPKKSKHAEHDFSSQEISRLKETEALFHSSLFRLQVSELLKEVSVKQKLKARIEEAAGALSDILKNLSAGKEYAISDHKWLESKAIKVPLVERPSHVKGTFQFQPPEEVIFSGSVVLDTMVKPDVEADLILQMPKVCFQKKDYLNQRYTRKRALYLSALASRLCKKKRVEDLKFTYYMGNPHKPVLVVTMKGQDLKSVKLCLHAVTVMDTFKLSRFHVDKNNIRPRWFFEKGESATADVEDEDALPGTPFYNSSLLHDICLLSNVQFMEKMLKNSEGLRNGIMLLKVWLRQRELQQGVGAFSSHLMSAYVVHLLMMKKINKMMNCYQIFRTTLLYLSKSDWILDPPSFFEEIPTKTHPSVDELRNAASCVFVDRTGYFNMAYMLSSSIFMRVKDEAQLSIEALERHDKNSFDVLFMTPISFSRKFDHIFHVKVTEDVHKAVCEKLEDFPQLQMDLGGHINVALSQHILQLLSKALDKRVHLVQANISQCKRWDVSDEPFSYDAVKFLTFGLVLDTSGAFNILDRGPSADSAEAKAFRDFWGDRSEMRRFKDGTIHEAVLWTDSTNQSDKRLVCKKIVQHVLHRHMGIPKSNVHYMTGRLDPLLHLTFTQKDSKHSYGTGEEQSLAIHHAFNHVNRAVRALTTIPLGIHSVQGIHPVFRHADVFPALPTSVLSNESTVISGQMVPKEGKALPQFVPAMEVICMLEGSGKWPEDYEAMQCMKALFHVKMGSELKDKHLLCVSIHSTHVDVLKDGYVFRLKISNTRELAVLRTVKTENGMVKFKDTEASLALEQEIIALPHITQLLHGIQQEHPVFSATVRLCKRWLASQMVWGLLCEEALELIVAYMFISPHPYTAPASPETGLLRFLHLLSRFNWKADPLIVNLNKELTEDDLSTIPKEFIKNRSTLPSMVIATPQDKQGTKWTKSSPAELFLQRLIILARESLKILESQILSQTAITDFKQIFRPPLQHYDLVIHLLKKSNVVSHQSVDSKSEIPANSAPSVGSQPLPVVNFNVAQKFFTDLQNIFRDVAMFFHDPFGGDVIGVVWKPEIKEKRDFRTSHLAYRKPVVDENDKVILEIEKDAILDDIRIIGGGIVECIKSPHSSDNN